ncbi:MAG TPA: glycoside hydrolase family 38 C-terminal domain-containing protein [bacterium]|nr:glycoside hydrolase family 38 C-terminal domain-containing protein [bacterium]
MEQARTLTVVVVTHTHWDREWYWPYERFRVQLVRVMDHVLDVLERAPHFRHFLLDGQTAALEDYLEVRPERAERVAAQVRAGRLGIGPWFTLPDELAVSGEALIRNLMLGHRVASRFGAAAKIGYCIDTFGHPASLPQILRGFDIDNFVFMRGLGERVDDLRSEFLWEAPDGGAVLAHFLSESYSNAAVLGATPEATVLHHGRMVRYDSLAELLERLAARAAAPAVLLMNGSDHLDVQEDLPALLDSLRARLPHRLIHGGVAEFLAAVRSHAGGAGLRTYRGDLLHGRYFHVDLGCLSTRVYLKQRNAETQALLQHLAEPLAAVALVLGAPVPPDLLWQAWRPLLHNHAHDSICGCSIDDVHAEMLARFDRAARIGDAAARHALDEIAARIEMPGGAGAPAGDAAGGPSVLVFNTLPWPRTAEAEAAIAPYLGYPFGVRTFEPAGYREIDLDRCALLDDEGREVTFEAGARQVGVEDPTNRRKVVTVQPVRFLARDIPAMGYRVYRFAPRSARRAPSSVRQAPSAVAPAGHTGASPPPRGATIENERYRVTAAHDGRLTIEDKEGGTLFPEVHYFEDSGDAGDEYAFARPVEDFTVDSRGDTARIAVVHDAAGQAIEIAQTLRLPASLRRDGRRRTARRVACPVRSIVRLLPGVRRIDVETTLDNRAADHRLRVIIPTGIAAETEVADDAAGVAVRGLTLPDGAGWEEPPSPGRPHQQFVAVEDGRRGFAVAAVGLHEHAVHPDGAIALTLLRCVGWLGRTSGVPRQGVAGPAIATPGAQCFGTHRFRYALIPYVPPWNRAQVWEPAAELPVPLIAAQLTRGAGARDGGGALPQRSFLQVSPRTVRVTAVKPAEDGSGIVVRLQNLNAQRVSAAVETPWEIREAAEVNMNEEERRTLRAASPHRVEIAIGPYAIETVRLRFA